MCLRKSEVAVERISVCNVIDKLMELGIHCYCSIPIASLICYCNSYDVILISKQSHQDAILSRYYRISSVIRLSFSFQNNPKNLDLSYKTDLDFGDCFGRVKLVLYQNFKGLIWLFVVILERGKHHLIVE